MKHNKTKDERKVTLRSNNYSVWRGAVEQKYM